MALGSSGSGGHATATGVVEQPALVVSSNPITITFRILSYLLRGFRLTCFGFFRFNLSSSPKSRDFNPISFIFPFPAVVLPAFVACVSGEDSKGERDPGPLVEYKIKQDWHRTTSEIRFLWFRSRPCRSRQFSVYSLTKVVAPQSPSLISSNTSETEGRSQSQ